MEKRARRESEKNTAHTAKKEMEKRMKIFFLKIIRRQ
jgi:hypothetical protein